jgi:Pex14 N-terminal domain/PUB domain
MSTPATNSAVQQAIAFLKDPRIQSAAVSQKEAFLKAKGLSAEDIANAIKLAGESSGLLPPVMLPRSEAVFDFYGFLLTVGGVLAAMGTGALLYHLWDEQRKTTEKEELKLLQQIIAKLEHRHVDQMSVLREIQLALLKESAKRKEGVDSMVTEIIHYPPRTYSRNSQRPTEPPSEQLPALQVLATSPRDSAASDSVDIKQLVNALFESPAKPTIQMLLDNLLGHPDDDKYGRINLSNPRFKEKLTTGPAFEVMKYVGFEMNENLLVYKGPSEFTKAKEVLDLLDKTS